MSHDVLWSTKGDGRSDSRIDRSLFFATSIPQQQQRK